MGFACLLLGMVVPPTAGELIHKRRHELATERLALGMWPEIERRRQDPDFAARGGAEARAQP